MKNKNYLIRLIAGIFTLSSFAMCTKGVNKVEEPVSSTLDVQNGSAGVQIGAVSAVTYTVQSSEWMVDGTKIPAGSTVYIPAGKRGALLLKNFKGTAAAPIVIINKGGKVTFSTTITASYG